MTSYIWNRQNPSKQRLQHLFRDVWHGLVGVAAQLDLGVFQLVLQITWASKWAISMGFPWGFGGAFKDISWTLRISWWFNGDSWVDIASLLGWNEEMGMQWEFHADLMGLHGMYFSFMGISWGFYYSFIDSSILSYKDRKTNLRSHRGRKDIYRPLGC